MTEGRFATINNLEDYNGDGLPDLYYIANGKEMGTFRLTVKDLWSDAVAEGYMDFRYEWNDRFTLLKDELSHKGTTLVGTQADTIVNGNRIQVLRKIDSTSTMQLLTAGKTLQVPINFPNTDEMMDAISSIDDSGRTGAVYVAGNIIMLEYNIGLFAELYPIRVEKDGLTPLRDCGVNYLTHSIRSNNGHYYVDSAHHVVIAFGRCYDLENNCYYGTVYRYDNTSFRDVGDFWIPETAYYHPNPVNLRKAYLAWLKRHSKLR
jgi:hypothetical protein